MDETLKTHWVYIEEDSKWYQTITKADLLDRPESHILWDSTPEEARAVLDARDGVPEGLTRYSYPTYLRAGPLRQVYHNALVPDACVFPVPGGWLHQILQRECRQGTAEVSRTDTLDRLERAVTLSPYPVRLWMSDMICLLSFLGREVTRFPKSILLSPSLRGYLDATAYAYFLSTGDFGDSWKKQEERYRRKQAKEKKARETAEETYRREQAVRDMVCGLTSVWEEADAFLPRGACVDVPCSRRAIYFADDLFEHLMHFLGLTEALGVRRKMLKVLKAWEAQWEKVLDINALNPVYVKTLRGYASARGVRPGRLYPPYWISQVEAVSGGDTFTAEEVTDGDRRRRKKVKSA